MELYHYFKPLSKIERESLSDSTARLLDNPDFVIFVRDCFSKADPISPTFLSRENDNPTSAAKRDGEKNVSRYILKLIIDKDIPVEELVKNTTQTQEIDFTKI